MSARRRQLEDLVVAAIRANLTYLLAVDPYAGELGGKDLSEVYDRLRGRVPSVLVATADSRVDLDIQPRHFIKVVDVELYLISGNMRSREEKLLRIILLNPSYPDPFGSGAADSAGSATITACSRSRPETA